MPPHDPRHGAVRIVRGVYALCFAIGGLNHLRDFALRGWRPYKSAPLPAVELYWSALVLLDFAVVVLIATGKTRAALLLALAIMVSDVAINVTATRMAGFDVYGWPLLFQAAVLGFILGSIAFVWPIGTPVPC